MRPFLSKLLLNLLVLNLLVVQKPDEHVYAEQTNLEEIESPQQTLANAFATIIEKSIPLEYEKRKDWGKTRNITVGLRNQGLKIYRRKKEVNHGVWKHYQIKQIDPEENFSVQVRNLKTIDGGRLAFTMLIDARLDARGSAKVYQYGVHVVTLVIEGDTHIQLELDCEVGARMQLVAGLPGVVVEPRVTDARLDLSKLHLRRISHAKGPLVKELSHGVQRTIEHELKGPKLTKKLNRAIERNRDHLEFSVSELLDSSWWPLASLPDLEKTTESR